MNARLLREYRARYQAVAELEQSELRRLTVHDCWQQLNALLGMAAALGLPLVTAERDEEADTVRQRWMMLKQGQA